jgi:hypothetical protein
MKNTLFLLFFAFFGLSTLRAQEGVGPGGSCECSSFFCSAKKTCSVQGYSCDCTCTVFVCNCSDCSKGHRPTASSVSISAEQLKNRRDFIQLLNGLGDATASRTAQYLNNSYNALENQDYDTYFEQGRLAETEVAKLGADKKQTLNNWMAAKGADIRF